MFKRTNTSCYHHPADDSVRRGIASRSPTRSHPGLLYREFWSPSGCNAAREIWRRCNKPLLRIGNDDHIPGRITMLYFNSPFCFRSKIGTRMTLISGGASIALNGTSPKAASMPARCIRSAVPAAPPPSTAHHPPARSPRVGFARPCGFSKSPGFVVGMVAAHCAIVGNTGFSTVGSGGLRRYRHTVRQLSSPAPATHHRIQHPEVRSIDRVFARLRNVP